jgi:hypothetical protein
MRVFLFQEQFHPMILDGTKPHTIRKTARCAPGDALSLRRWTGRPYRSKQAVLMDAVCKSVQPICIGHALMPEIKGVLVSVNGFLLSGNGIAALARADGFKCATDMLSWFDETHGLPFEGFLIEWEPAE